MRVSKTARQEALLLHRRGPPADPRVDEGAWSGATREAVNPCLRFPGSIGPTAIRLSPERCIPPVDGSRPRGPTSSATRERVPPCACLPASIRPHGRMPSGQAIHPCACLPVSMRPMGVRDRGMGTPFTPLGCILHRVWVTASLGGVHPFRHCGHRSCSMGVAITWYGRIPPSEVVTDAP
jgi:hypothetical protein